MIFIFGYPRSGTTLLRSVLSQHTQITLRNEPELFFGFHNAGVLNADKIQLSKPLLDRMRQIGMCQKYLNQRTAYVEELVGGTFKQSDLYLKLLNCESNAVIGEKSLNNLFFTRRIRELYPDSCFLWLIRDPRSAVWSRIIKQLNAKGDSFSSERWVEYIGQTLRHAKLWKAWHAWGFKNLRDLTHVQQLRFEDFLTDPKANLLETLRLLDLEFEEEMMRPEKRSNDPVFQSDGAYAHKNIPRALDPSRIKAYSDMPKQLIYMVEQVCRREMMLFGYALEKPKVTISDRLKIRFAKIRSYLDVSRSVRKHLHSRGAM